MLIRVTGFILPLIILIVTFQIFVGSKIPLRWTNARPPPRPPARPSVCLSAGHYLGLFHISYKQQNRFRAAENKNMVVSI